jgi:hypothetical protein
MALVTEPSIGTPERRSHWSRRNVSVVLVVAVLVASVAVVSHTHVARVHTVDGIVTAVNQDATAFGVRSQGARDGEGYLLRTLREWQDTSGAWHTTDSAPIPDCTPGLSDGAHVQLGIVDIPGFAGAPGSTDVVWLKCLSGSTHRYG